MAAEHAPPPGGGAAGKPAPSVGDAGTARGESAAAQATSPTGDPVAARPDAAYGAGGATARGRRLLPSSPDLEHAPLLLGLDAAGGEHPQGPGYEDDEDLVGRMWGCVCGWRGTVRDISTRPFHPRVGDGGGLRRQRLARSDRDTRAELEDHLARSTPAPADPADAISPDVTSSIPATSVEDAAPQPLASGRPRGRRRRLTVPRDIPLAVPAVTVLPAAHDQVDGSEHHAPSEDHATSEPTVDPSEPDGSEAAPSSRGTSEPNDSLTHLKSAAGAHDGDAGEPSSVDLLEHAVARAEAARCEHAEAESALDGAVAAARKNGLSWRTIGRATGVGHREAAARWGPPGGGPSL
ncbi:hypothetical protein [Actinomycetospora soli]|uniref:hypothetical protein n=1 Tax=Actinomycetospora soli TaxID=2893887 RepID=UPI001E2B71C8|nr:hypothetical protein [Actinomycetospora soli]MCD2191571.1 hypothetical protein [Actinomycetospora soli]